MSNLPTLNEFREAAKTTAIRECKSADGKYLGYKYTENTIYSEEWNIVTLNARGIAFDAETGECVLRPYKKFFNYSELIADGNYKNLWRILEKTDGFMPVITPRFRYMDKLDGSLYIASVLKNGEFLGKTSGSFNAWQGKWAEEWVKNHVDITFEGDGTAKSGTMKCNCTFLFEIICDDDLHPITYDYEACVLHGIVDNDTGDELPIEDVQAFASKWNLKVAEIIEFNSLDEAIEYSKNLPANKEGGVITFDSGFKVKVKGIEFLALQKLYHNLTPRYIWENFNELTGEFNTGVEELIPEEMPEVKEFAADMKKSFSNTLNRVIDFANSIAKRDISRKDVYLQTKDELVDPCLVSAVMNIYTSIINGCVATIENVSPSARASVKKYLQPSREIIE